MKTGLRLSFASLVVPGIFWLSASAWAESSARIRKMEPAAETEAAVKTPFNVFFENKVWFGTMLLKVQPFESLVVVRDGQGVELLPNSNDPTTYAAKLQLTGKETTFEVVRVFKDGRLQTIQVEFEYPEWSDPNPPAPTQETKVAPTQLVRGSSKTLLSHGLGLTLVDYSDSRLSEGLSMQAITAKLGYLYSFIPLWDLSASAYMTAVQLGSSVPGNTRFFGANFRVARHWVEKIKKPWDLSLGGGLFYSTMIVPGGGYGFNDVVGPQLLPSATYDLGQDRTLGSYLKFSLIGGGFELATGFSYGFIYKTIHAFTVNLDLSRIVIGVGGVSMQSNTGTLGFGYTLP